MPQVFTYARRGCASGNEAEHVERCPRNATEEEIIAILDLLFGKIPKPEPEP
ncbi:MAG: hypothetical protein ABIO52_06520 [Gemmatimonadaceae bacterium]